MSNNSMGTVWNCSLAFSLVAAANKTHVQLVRRWSMATRADVEWCETVVIQCVRHAECIVSSGSSPK